MYLWKDWCKFGAKHNTLQHTDKRSQRMPGKGKQEKHHDHKLVIHQRRRTYLKDDQRYEFSDEKAQSHAIMDRYTTNIKI